MAAQRHVGVCSSFQQLLHYLHAGKKPDMVKFCNALLSDCVWKRQGVTRSFPVAIAKESGEWPLQSRSVLALWESRRATTFLTFYKNKRVSDFNMVSSVTVCMQHHYTNTKDSGRGSRPPVLVVVPLPTLALLLRSSFCSIKSIT